MNKLGKWFNEPRVKFTTDEGEFVIYKGFKITKVNDEYKLQDVRLSDFYTPVREKDLRLLNELGFTRGIDFIVQHRDSRRIKIYQLKIDKLKENLIISKSKLNENKSFFSKKIRNDSENIDRFTNLLYFYKHRIEQYKNKYNLN